MDFIVIKSEVINEAKEVWGVEVVEEIFKELRNNHPDSLIQNLESSGGVEKLSCLFFLLQNRYQRAET